eukprot:Em0018g940a
MASVWCSSTTSCQFDLHLLHEDVVATYLAVSHLWRVLVPSGHTSSSETWPSNVPHIQQMLPALVVTLTRNQLPDLFKWHLYMLNNGQVQCDNSTIKKLEFEFHSVGWGNYVKPPNDQYKLDSVKSQTIHEFMSILDSQINQNAPVFARSSTPALSPPQLKFLENLPTVMVFSCLQKFIQWLKDGISKLLDELKDLTSSLVHSEAYFTKNTNETLQMPMKEVLELCGPSGLYCEACAVTSPVFIVAKGSEALAVVLFMKQWSVHISLKELQEKVAERYYWKGMASDIANYCSTCLVCQRQKKIPCNIPGHWFLAVIEVQNRCVKLYDSVFESFKAMLSLFYATSCCKSNHDKDLSEHLMILGSFHFTRILASNKTTSMTVVFLFASPSSVVTINDKTEQFILNQCSTGVLLDVKASIEKFTSNSSETVKSGFFDVYIQGKRDGVFSSINPTELKSLFRKWPIINCEVVDAVQHFLYGIAIDEGYGGNRANILAWDVLYPELMISIISKSKEMNYEEAELYYVDNLLN